MTCDRIQLDLLSEFRNQDKSCHPISAEDVRDFEKLIIQNFCPAARPFEQLWEGIQATEVFNLNEDDGILMVSHRLNMLDGQMVVLVEDWKGYSGLMVSSGRDWNCIISNMYNFSWHLYHQESDTLIARNDHDFLLISSRTKQTKHMATP